MSNGKPPIPGEGDSTPIVWGGRVFLLAAIPAGTNAPAARPGRRPPTRTYQFVVLCLDRASGKILWQRVARQEAPHEGHQENNTFASASPVTDGQRLLAYFGSRGLHCYDFEGNLKWEKDFGKMKTKMGLAKAPPRPFGAARSSSIGTRKAMVSSPRWTPPPAGNCGAPRATKATGWSTPLIVECNGRRQVIVNATKKVRAYDLATGKEIWSCSGQTVNAIPSPVAAGGVVYLTSGFSGNALQAIRLGPGGRSDRHRRHPLEPRQEHPLRAVALVDR